MASWCLSGERHATSPVSKAAVSRLPRVRHHTWIRSFSDKLRRPSGDWEQAVGRVRRRRLAGMRL